MGRAEKFARYTVDETFKKVGDYISGALSTKIIRILKAYTNHKSAEKRATVSQIIIPGKPELCLLVKTKPG